MNLVNQALLTKQFWRLLNNPMLLTLRILPPKYYSKDNLVKVKPHSNSSKAWKGMLYGRDLIANYSSWKVGDGDSKFHDMWIPYIEKSLSHFIPYARPDSLKAFFLLRSTSTEPSWYVNRIYDKIPSFII